MINADDADAVRTFDVPGARVYAVDGRDGPLAVYDAANDSAYISTLDPVDLRDWR